MLSCKNSLTKDFIFSIYIWRGGVYETGTPELVESLLRTRGSVDLGNPINDMNKSMWINIGYYKRAWDEHDLTFETSTDASGSTFIATNMAFTRGQTQRTCPEVIN